MSEIKIDVEPGEVGFDPGRMARLDRHFARYVDDGRLAGLTVVVSRRGRVVHLAHHGLTDLEAGRPVADDTLWRIYSMTKPVTSVAAMMLVEEGALDLNDPISRYLPAFAETRVYRAGSALNPGTVPAVEPIRVWHLLTHTAGLTYGFHHAHPVDEMYRGKGFDFGVPRGADLAAACEAWAGMPLLFQPGTEWNYSVATDVLGRLVEVVSGQPLDEFLHTRVLAPLDMNDTRWWVEDDDLDRLAELYVPGLHRHPALGEAAKRRPTFLSGGGGLVSTAADYHRFTQMLLGGGALDGIRLLGPRTVAFMTRNHLPGRADLETFGRPIFAESSFRGVGFGLGFSVVEDPVAGKVPTSAGEYAWGGLASTAFYVDPVEEVTGMIFTQMVPSSTYPLRAHLRGLVTQAIVD